MKKREKARAFRGSILRRHEQTVKLKEQLQVEGRLSPALRSTRPSAGNGEPLKGVQVSILNLLE
jgi:hypothetical protein